jgi:hypothetical protein
MDTTPRPRLAPSTVRATLRYGLGAAGVAVAVAFVGATVLGAGQAHAAGVAGGLTPAPATAPAQHPHRHHAAHPANLPPATTTAYRYSFRDGQLVEL